jgi:error-prone DNA polymerase
VSDYAELSVTSNFSFLRGASHPEELMIRAAELGLRAIAITDHNSVAGVVRAFSALKELARLQEATPAGAPAPVLPRLIPGARLVLDDSPVDWLALPTDLPAWSRLTRLLTLGKRRAAKGDCHLSRADLHAGCRGMVLIALPPDPGDADADR